MADVMDLSGRWEGLFIHQPDQLTLSITLVDQGGSLTGYYSITDPPDHPYPEGSLTGSASGSAVILSISADDPHGARTFNGSVEQAERQLMILGSVLIASSKMPIAAMVLFQSAEVLIEAAEPRWTADLLQN